MQSKAIIIKRMHVLLLAWMAVAGTTRAQVATGDKTSFQISDAWDSTYDVRSDVAMVYGVNDAGGDFEKRVESWRSKGYNVQFMTGIAWGQYQDYFMGKFDGKTHWDEGQVTAKGDTIWHGRYVPYVVPTASFLSYMKTHIKRAIDAGVTAIYLEEPEFWSRAGYSESFKTAWQTYYGFAWMPQHQSPEATYLSAKLKYHLYYEALKDVFTYAKKYSDSTGKKVKCFVPTHSLINYASWNIVSPEASLASLSVVDGYIAQVWTGTSREPVFFNGIKKERVFENAFLEYGCMLSMTKPTGRKIYFLTDPIEDRRQTWDDYKRNYQATFTAQLLYPSVASYEVMPWPRRIYKGRFRLENNEAPQPISPAYATQMQVMVNALNNMPASTNKISGSQGIGVLLSNSIMFQRFVVHPDYSDSMLSDFYGMALPLLKRGIPVEMVHMENLSSPNALKDIRVLVMSYANMKPMDAAIHRQLAAWVKNGGQLLYYGTDTDPYQTVREWWNTGGNAYASPSQHLFELLGLGRTPAAGMHAVGRGNIVITKQDPKELVMNAGADGDFVTAVKKAYEHTSGRFMEKNSFLLQRGPYDIAAVMDENTSQLPLTIKGPVIDLFDPQLPVLAKKTVAPGEQSFLYNLNRLDRAKPFAVLASAARVYDEKIVHGNYSFLVKSPSGTVNAMRILLPAKPLSVLLSNSAGTAIQSDTDSWDEATHTLLLRFANSSSGIGIQIKVKP